jgi:hypothetical protein
MGEPLENGTPLARFIVRGEPRAALRVRRDAKLGFATGKIGAPRVGYTDLIVRVREIAHKAETMIDEV